VRVWRRLAAGDTVICVAVSTTALGTLHTTARMIVVTGA
jgi:hypothetical protein